MCPAGSWVLLAPLTSVLQVGFLHILHQESRATGQEHPSPHLLRHRAVCLLYADLAGLVSGLILEATLGASWSPSLHFTKDLLSVANMLLNMLPPV